MRKGQTISEATRQKMKASAKKRILAMPHTNAAGWNKGIKTGIKPGNYKGESASYSAHHHWVKYHLGKASENLCVACGSDAKEWSNISGGYLRELDDWQPMCVKCHRKEDDVVNKSWDTRRSGTK